MMDRDTRTMILWCGSMVFGIWYLIGIGVAGLAWGNKNAVFLAIATAGVTYLSYFGQATFPEAAKANMSAVALTIVLGLFAGVSLIVGH